MFGGRPAGAIVAVNVAGRPELMTALEGETESQLAPAVTDGLTKVLPEDVLTVIPCWVAPPGHVNVSDVALRFRSPEPVVLTFTPKVPDELFCPKKLTTPLHALFDKPTVS